MARVAVLVLAVTGAASCSHAQHSATRTSPPPTPSSVVPASRTAVTGRTGSGGPSPGAPTSAAPVGAASAAGRSAFIRAADAACAMATRQLAVVPAANGPSELVSFLRARLAVQQDLLGRLDRLAPPAADIAASLLKPFQRAVVRQQQLLPDIARAISHGDDVQLANLHTDFDLAAHPRSVAAFVRFYGFTMCGSFDYFHTP